MLNYQRVHQWIGFKKNLHETNRNNINNWISTKKMSVDPHWIGYWVALREHIQEKWDHSSYSFRKRMLIYIDLSCFVLVYPHLRPPPLLLSCLLSHDCPFLFVAIQSYGCWGSVTMADYLHCCGKFKDQGAHQAGTQHAGNCLHLARNWGGEIESKEDLRETPGRFTPPGLFVFKLLGVLRLMFPDVSCRCLHASALGPTSMELPESWVLEIGGPNLTEGEQKGTWWYVYDCRTQVLAECDEFQMQVQLPKNANFKFETSVPSRERQWSSPQHFTILTYLDILVWEFAVSNHPPWFWFWILGHHCLSWGSRWEIAMAISQWRDVWVTNS